MTTEGETVALRCGNVGDAPVLAAIHRAALAGLDERPWRAAEYAQLLAAAGTLSWIAGTGPDGFILARCFGEEMEILMLAVVPGARRRGVGGTLVDAALAHGQVLGARRAFLEVAVDNPAALALYAGRAFVEMGRRRGYYAREGGGAVDACLMARAAGAAVQQQNPARNRGSREADDL